MKLKKLLAMGMAIMLVIALAGCGGDNKGGNVTDENGMTPYQLLEQASQKMDEADGVAYTMTMDMNMTVPGMDDAIAMNMSGDVKQQKVGENNFNLAYNMNTDMSALGAGVVDMEMYYTDGYMYYNVPAANQKYKVPMAMEEAIKQANSGALDGIQEDMIKTSAVADEGEGKVITMTLDGTKMTDMVMDMAGDVAASLGEGGNITIGDIEYVAHLDNEGNMTSLTMPMEMTISAQGQEMKMTMNMTMDVTAVGGVTVDLPADLADYPETTLE